MKGKNVQSERNTEGKAIAEHLREIIFDEMIYGLRTDLESCFAGKQIDAWSICDYEYSKKFHTLRLQRHSVYSTSGFDCFYFRASGRSYLLGLFPRHTTQTILKIDTLPQKVLNCIVYDDRVIPFVRERVLGIADILGIEMFNITHPNKSGSLSLANSENGTLSLAGIERGSLSFMESGR